ncbi:MAG: ATP phosphoribosyltransferase [Candidatus Doudnabacteria bacterium]|nr:ATP phosphoribosyltransferase [Candidatus Doudnabacteria bacterium]
MKTPERLRIAVQKSGRLNQGSMDFLGSCGLTFAPNGHSLILPCQNFDLDVLYLRDDDIPEYVSRGVADFGIVGQNVLAEKEFELKILKKFDFGKCRLMIAAPADSVIKTPKDLEGERIATSYPKLLTDYLKKEKLEAAIIPISGSVEITPDLNLADAICDIVQTGTTLKAHNLVPLFTILESQAVLIESPINKQAKEKFLLKCGIN